MDPKMSYGIAGLLVGVVLTWVFATGMYHRQDYRPMPMTSSHQMMEDSNMSSSMDGMMSGLNNKTGDEFDRAFLSEMIVHHQGAIEMAHAALQNAKHQEIKDLANNIISAQSKEIDQMKAWQQAWYK